MKKIVSCCKYFLNAVSYYKIVTYNCELWEVPQLANGETAFKHETPCLEKTRQQLQACLRDKSIGANSSAWEVSYESF